MQIPSYVQNVDQEYYNQLLSLVLIAGLSDMGWTVPNQSSASITALAPTMPLGTIWYNTDLNKLVVKTASGIETIQSV